MQHLLAKYLARPTVANALRVARYDRAHPFAALMLNHLESALCAECYAIAASSQQAKG
jgi:hypothetical protein